MLIEGVDTYITIAEANDYVNKYFLTTDPLRVQWDALPENDKEVYLRRSFDQINQLPFTGAPKSPCQTLPFPRKCNFTAQDMQNVKYAQAEQAIALSDTVAAQETVDRIKLRRAGVVQYTIGDLSEKFQSGLPSESNATFFGLAERAYKLLSKWLSGGYRVCTSIKRPYGYPYWWLP